MCSSALYAPNTAGKTSMNARHQAAARPTTVARGQNHAQIKTRGEKISATFDESCSESRIVTAASAKKALPRINWRLRLSRFIKTNNTGHRLNITIAALRSTIERLTLI